MKLCCFTPVPWPDLDARPERWPFPGDTFDADRCATLYEQAVEQLVHAERCGFDWVGMGEDHMTAYGLTPNPLMLLHVVASRTERVKLVTMGCPVPLLNPLRVAEELAMLDITSRGRVIAGLIRGVPQNYKAYNVDPGESRSRFAEGVELITKAWIEKDIFAWEGDHYRFPTVSLWPRPMQEPHPPLIFSGNSVESAKGAAAKRAAIAAIHLYNRDAIEKVAAAMDAYREVASNDGWTPSPDLFLVGLQACIAPTDSEARDLLDPALDYQYSKLSGTFNAEKRKLAATTPGYGLSPTEESPPTLAERVEAGTVLVGSPETVADQINALRDRLGVGVVSLHVQVGNMPHNVAMRSIELAGERVRPLLAQHAGAMS